MVSASFLKCSWTQDGPYLWPQEHVDIAMLKSMIYPAKRPLPSTKLLYISGRVVVRLLFYHMKGVEEVGRDGVTTGAQANSPVFFVITSGRSAPYKTGDHGYEVGRVIVTSTFSSNL